jgi:hypothetical protein
LLRKSLNIIPIETHVKKKIFNLLWTQLTHGGYDFNKDSAHHQEASV